MRMSSGARVVLLAAALCAAAPASAQQPVDSVAIRMRETLRRLGRLPGADTGAVAEDTLPVTPIQVVQRRTAAPATSSDSVITALLALPGYTATQYRGTAADFDAGERVLVLRGDSTNRATVVRMGTELSADSLIRYDEAAQRIRAEGAPIFKSPESDPVESQRVVYDVTANRGSAFGARTKYSEGATWYVSGDLPSVTPGVVYGAHTDFTSCELEVPHYHFTADNIKIIAGRILVARPVRLYFADVPVAWLPFIAQSLGSGRASGLLMPRFSINDIVRRGGYRRRVSNIGFYWAMSEYTDATLAMDWFSGSFTSLTGSFRYVWTRQFLNGSVNFRQYWKDEGGTSTAFDANSDWRVDERTTFRASARFSSEGDFVRRYSFEPAELTQSINSTGGLDRRFDWGNVSVSGNRDQYLTDDRVLMTLPQVQLNLSQITLFRAPALRASWYNNLLWSGSANGLRRTTGYTGGVADSVLARNPESEDVNGSVNSSFRLGNLAWSQRAELQRGSTFDALLPVPAASILGTSPSGRALVASAEGAAALAAMDVTQSNLTWNTSLSYQQTLIGSTSITPQLSLSGNARRSDTIDVARDRFVSAPNRFSFGAGLKSDLFGFFPGVGPFEAIRHKVSPSLDFSYAPEVTSTELQERVFGRQAIQPRKELTVGLSQTFEAKRKASTDSTAAGAAAGAAPSGAPGLGQTPMLPNDTTGGLTSGPLGAAGAAAGGFGNANLRRAPRAQIVNLLTLRTNAVMYDFVEADERGKLWGYKTTQIQSQIASDLLQGLSISMAHDLFAEDTVAAGSPRPEFTTERRFDLHLASLNLGFSLNNRSAILRGFGLFGGDEDGDTAVAQLQPRTPQDPLVQPTAATDESSVIPRSDRRADDPMMQSRTTGGPVGSWNANFTYSLAPARSEFDAASQVMQMSFTVKPTQNWDLGWRTSYDVEKKAFNDHMLTLTRDIHDWDAHFDFARTTTGNWYFRFDVSLKANHDFKFDYKQQNTDATSTNPR